MVSKLAREFKVQQSTVTTLREQKKLGFGDIAIVLGLAQEEAKREKVPLDVAIDRVVARRETGAGWGQVAHDLDLKLGKVVSEVKEVGKGLAAVQKPDRVEPAKGEKPEVGRPEKLGMPERPEKLEKLEKPAKAEQIEKLERPAKLERVEKPERVEKVERLEQVVRPEKPVRVERPERVERPGRH